MSRKGLAMRYNGSAMSYKGSAMMHKGCGSVRTYGDHRSSLAVIRNTPLYFFSIMSTALLLGAISDDDADVETAAGPTNSTDTEDSIVACGSARKRKKTKRQHAVGAGGAPFAKHIVPLQPSKPKTVSYNVFSWKTTLFLCGRRNNTLHNRSTTTETAHNT